MKAGPTAEADLPGSPLICRSWCLPSGMNVMVLGLGILAAGGALLGSYPSASSARTFTRALPACEIFLFPCSSAVWCPGWNAKGAAWISERIAAPIARFTRHHDGEQNEKAVKLRASPVVSPPTRAPPTTPGQWAVASKVARDLVDHHGVTPRRAASMLDTSSPWARADSLGLPALLLGSIFAPLADPGREHEFSPMALAPGRHRAVLPSTRWGAVAPPPTVPDASTSGAAWLAAPAIGFHPVGLFTGSASPPCPGVPMPDTQPERQNLRQLIRQRRKA